MQQQHNFGDHWLDDSGLNFELTLENGQSFMSPAIDVLEEGENYSTHPLAPDSCLSNDHQNDRPGSTAALPPTPSDNIFYEPTTPVMYPTTPLKQDVNEDDQDNEGQRHKFGQSQPNLMNFNGHQFIDTNENTNNNFSHTSLLNIPDENDNDDLDDEDVSFVAGSESCSSIPQFATQNYVERKMVNMDVGNELGDTNCLYNQNNNEVTKSDMDPKMSFDEFFRQFFSRKRKVEAFLQVMSDPGPSGCKKRCQSMDSGRQTSISVNPPTLAIPYQQNATLLAHSASVEEVSMINSSASSRARHNSLPPVSFGETACHQDTTVSLSTMSASNLHDNWGNESELDLNGNLIYNTSENSSYSCHSFQVSPSQQQLYQSSTLQAEMGTQVIPQTSLSPQTIASQTTFVNPPSYQPIFCPSTANSAIVPAEPPLEFIPTSAIFSHQQTSVSDDVTTNQQCSVITDMYGNHVGSVSVNDVAADETTPSIDTNCYQSVNIDETWIPSGIYSDAFLSQSTASMASIDSVYPGDNPTATPLTRSEMAASCVPGVNPDFSSQQKIPENYKQIILMHSARQPESSHAATSCHNPVSDQLSKVTAASQTGNPAYTITLPQNKCSPVKYIIMGKDSGKLILKAIENHAEPESSHISPSTDFWESCTREYFKDPLTSIAHTASVTSNHSNDSAARHIFTSSAHPVSEGSLHILTTNSSTCIKREPASSCKEPEASSSLESSSLSLSSVSSSTTASSALNVFASQDIVESHPNHTAAAIQKTPNWDPGLLQATKESLDSGKMTPIVKQELKLRILSRRLQEGKDAIEVKFTPPPKSELTPEEEHKKKHRQELNRVAAANHRERKKKSRLSMEQECDVLETKKSELQEKLEELEREKTMYLNLCHQHAIPVPMTRLHF